MATSREREAELFSSSPARPSHTRTAPELLQKQKQLQQQGVSQKRKNLKRSASTASLLTPPGSPEKEKLNQYRSKGKNTVSGDELDDEDEDEAMGSPGSPRGRKGKHVRTRSDATKQAARKSTGKAAPVGVEMVGRIFMEAGKGAGASGSTKIHSLPLMAQPSILPPLRNPMVDATKAATEHINKMVLDSDSDASPLAPTTPEAGKPRSSDPLELPLPPAFRKNGGTPLRRSKRLSTDAPTRDSPNNPFLSSSPPRPRRKPEPIEDKPTLTYVFRGVKAVFRNPAYGFTAPKEGDPSTLPPSHPEFSPDAHTVPKLLLTKPGLADAQDSESEDEVEERLRVRPKRLFPEPTKESPRSGRGRGSNKRIRLAPEPSNPFLSSPKSITKADKEKGADTSTRTRSPRRKQALDPF